MTLVTPKKLPRPLWLGVLASALAVQAQPTTDTTSSSSTAKTEPAATVSSTEITANKSKKDNGGTTAKMPAAKTDETVELSPFDVVVEKDKAFLATNAGSATKLGLDLEEMPAAYSVMTREFLDALGITNLEQSSEWVVGGAKAGTDGTPNDSTSTPNTVFTTQRGQMNQTGQQRNFFLNAGIGDTYNMERIDFGRGPNAVLFNFGDINNPFAGGVSAQTKQGRIGHSSETVTMRVGSWDFYRTSLDVNRPLTANSALRINTLLQDADGYRIGARDDRKALSLALTIRPTDGQQLNIGANYDRIARTQTYGPIFDNLSGWDGRTVFDGPITNAILGAGRNSTTRAPLAGATMGNGFFLSSSGDVQGVTRMSTTQRNVYIPGQGIMNWQNYATTQRADANEYIPMYSGGRTFSRYDLWSQNVSNGVLQANTIAPNNLLGLGTGAISGGSPLLYQENLPGDRFDRAILGSKFTVPDKRFTLAARKTPFMIERNKGVNLNYTLRLTPDLFFNLSGDANQTARRILNQGSANRMRYAYIDINRLLPDGTANPNFLEPYSDDVNIAYRNYTIKNTGIRPALNYRKDFGAWGFYTLNVGGSLTTRTIKDRQWILSLAQASDPRMWAGDASVVKVREYFYNPTMPLGLEGDLPFYTNVFDTSNSVVGNSRSTVRPGYVNNGGSDYIEKNKGVTAAFAGRYFFSQKLQKHRLITTVGTTIQNSDTYRRDLMIRGDMPTSWDSVSMLWKPDAPSDWGTLTYTPKDANGNPTATIARPAITRPRNTAVEGVAARQSQYANDRFRDDYNLPRRIATTKNYTAGLVYNLTDWVNTKLNYSNSFTPPAVGAIDINTDPALPVTAFGYDARLSFTPFRGRLVVNLGWFYNESANSRVTSPAQSPINSLFATRDYTDLNTNNRNSFGYYDVTGSDYQATNNTGQEIEIVGQVTRGLQVTGSFSRYHGRQFERFPLTAAYVLDHAEEFMKVLTAAGGKLDTTTKPIGAPSAPGMAIPDPAITGLSSAQNTNRNNAISAYNNIWVQYDAVVNKTTDTQYSNSGREWGYATNAFVRYEIQSGFFKGVRAGVGVNFTQAPAWSTQAANLIANPSYDKTKALNTNTGVLGSDGRYTYKDSAGIATGFNAPWMPDPNINQYAPPLNIADRAINTVINLGYRRTFGKGAGWLRAKEMNINIVINNPINQQTVFNDAGGTLRAPNGDYYNNQFSRINTSGGLVGYQEPINGSVELTLKF